MLMTVLSVTVTQGKLSVIINIVLSAPAAVYLSQYQGNAVANVR